MSSRTNSQTDDMEMTASVSLDAEAANQPKKFAKHKKIAKLMMDTKFTDAVNEYLVHYQDNKMSDTLLLWNNLTKIQEIKVVEFPL